MHTIDVLLKRRSIRRFKPKEVPWDNVVSMLKCAMNAPVAGNVFGTKFIVIRDPKNIKSIADGCHNQAWISSAPLVIAVVAEPEHQERYYGNRGARLYTVQNAAACAMNIINTAESLGLGSCWVSSFDEDKLRGALGMPENVHVHVIIPIGFADEKPNAPGRPWIRAVTYLEKWWGGRKLPAYGFYSENVMKMTGKAGDAIEKVAKKLLGKKKEDKKEKK